MEILTVFETVILSHLCEDIDNEAVYRLCQSHQKYIKSVTLSNNGGYQGHGFESETLFNTISKCMPQRSNKMIKKFDIQAWVNINSDFHWNDIHSHSDDGVLLSGVYYVKAPNNCGNLRLYDPRYLKGKNLYDSYYFEERGDYLSVAPQEKLMLFFPPWLPHMVEPNRSGQERVSVAFNIINPIF